MPDAKGIALKILRNTVSRAELEKLLIKQGDLPNLARYSIPVYGSEWKWLLDLLEKHPGDDTEAQTAVSILIANGPPTLWQKDPRRIDQYFKNDHMLLLYYVDDAMERGKRNPYIEQLVSARDNASLTARYNRAAGLE